MEGVECPLWNDTVDGIFDSNLIGLSRVAAKTFWENAEVQSADETPKYMEQRAVNSETCVDDKLGKRLQCLWLSSAYTDRQSQAILSCSEWILAIYFIYSRMHF